TPTTMPLFTLDNVTLGKGRQRRLCDVCVTIESGVTAVLGASGAGKTSLLNLLVGFERPTRATRRGLQSSITPNGHATPIYWVPHDGGLWPHLTARQHLEFVASPASGGDAAITHWLAAFDLL